jgi:hypothetical protein
MIGMFQSWCSMYTNLDIFIINILVLYAVVWVFSYIVT